MATVEQFLAAAPAIEAYDDVTPTTVVPGRPETWPTGLMPDRSPACHRCHFGRGRVRYWIGAVYAAHFECGGCRTIWLETDEEIVRVESFRCEGCNSIDILETRGAFKMCSECWANADYFEMFIEDGDGPLTVRIAGGVA